jgi:hypothetical protein
MDGAYIARRYKEIDEPLRNVFGDQSVAHPPELEVRAGVPRPDLSRPVEGV